MFSLLRYSAVALVVVLAIGLCAAQADDAEAVKEKLFQAKKAYDAEVQKFKKAAGNWLDKREDDARKAGNRKLVDQIKGERDAFEKSGELPSTVPLNVRELVNAARMKLDKAYSAAIKEYLLLKMDDAAGSTEKEQHEFSLASAVAFGKRTYLSALVLSEVKVSFELQKDSAKYKMNGMAIPHSMFMVPFTRDEASVSFFLPPKALAFCVSVAVPTYDTNKDDPATALTFEVLADGKSLWKSEPVAKRDTFQTCTVLLGKVKKLTLKVHCPVDGANAHAVWFGPFLAE